MQNLPRKPFKIQVWKVILAVILELWAAPNTNLYFYFFLFPFFRSRARLGAVLAAKLEPSWHSKAIPNSSKINTKNDLNSSGPRDRLGPLIFRFFQNRGANLRAKMAPTSTQNLRETVLMLKTTTTQKTCSGSCQGSMFKVRGP